MTGFTGNGPLDDAVTENLPCPLNEDDYRQLFAHPQVRQDWGIEDGDRMEDWARKVYAAKFNHYSSAGPGFVGKVIILTGDVLGNHCYTFYQEAGQWRLYD